MKPGKAKCGCVRDVRNVPLLSCTLYTLHPAITSFRRRPCKIGCLQGRGTLLDQKGIKLGPSTALEFLEGPLAGNVQVDRDGGGHDCKCIRDGDQASPAREGWTGQPLLIALSIPAFVVMIHEFDDASGELHLAEHTSTRCTMLLHHRMFLFAC